MVRVASNSFQIYYSKATFGTFHVYSGPYTVYVSIYTVWTVCFP
jgi:hypothetical protein